MRLDIFDIDGTLTQAMKADTECFVRSLTDICGFGDVDTDWSRYKHATDSGIFTRFTKLKLDDHRLPPRFRNFASTLLVCLLKLHWKPLLHLSQERRCCFRAWRVVGSMESHSLRVRGVIPLVLKWPVPVCATTTIRQHRVTTR